MPSLCHNFFVTLVLALTWASTSPQPGQRFHRHGRRLHVGEFSSTELFIEGSILMEEEFWHEAERVWAYAMKTRPKNRVAKFKRAVCVSEIGEDWAMAKSAFGGGHQRRAFTERYDPFNPNQMIPPVDAWLWLAATPNTAWGNLIKRGSHMDAFLAKAGEKARFV